jgi:choline monooxygenase
MNTESLYLTPLPAGWYRDPDPFQAERHGLFAHSWMPLAPAATLRAEGAYVCSNLAGWPLFAWRDAAGTLRAFHNTCRHQKMPMLQAGRGVLEELRCPFHGWIYGQDGCLKHASPPVVPDVDDLSSIQLNSITISPWKGLLFIAVDDENSPGTLDQAFAEISDHMPDLDVDWNYAGTDSIDLMCNWKTYLDFGSALDTPADESAAALKAAAAAAKMHGDSLVVIDDIGGGTWLWVWPMLGIHITEKTVVVSQLIARTMIRSRLERHVFVRPSSDGAAALTAWSKVGVRAKQAADHAQKALAAANDSSACTAEPTPSPAPYGLHTMVRAIHIA